MKTKIFVVLAAILFVPMLLSAQMKSDTGKHKIVIQFTDADSVSQVRALMQAENIRKVWADAEIELVCLGGGLDLLTMKNSKVRARITEWSEKGVTFTACNNSMTLRGIKKEDLIPEALVIPSAVVELAIKQEEGWSYFRGGK